MYKPSKAYAVTKVTQIKFSGILFKPCNLGSNYTKLKTYLN